MWEALFPVHATLDESADHLLTVPLRVYATYD